MEALPGTNAGTEFVTVNFLVTHAALASALTCTADYAIAADFCNFDQNNGSLTFTTVFTD